MHFPFDNILHRISTVLSVTTVFAYTEPNGNPRIATRKSREVTRRKTNLFDHASKRMNSLLKMFTHSCKIISLGAQLCPLYDYELLPFDKSCFLFRRFYKVRGVLSPQSLVRRHSLLVMVPKIYNNRNLLHLLSQRLFLLQIAVYMIILTVGLEHCLFA
jgi:hypothetical protein